MRSAPARAVALYETFLAGSYEKAEELDDSSGNFGMFVDGLFRGWVKARQAAGADPDETARRLLRLDGRRPVRLLLPARARPREGARQAGARGIRALHPRAVRRERDRRPGTGERERDPAYLRRRAAEILRAILAEQRNVEAYVALCEATELSPADCLALAKMLQARRKPADALAWVERGLALEKKRPSSSAGLRARASSSATSCSSSGAATRRSRRRGRTSRRTRASTRTPTSCATCPRPSARRGTTKAMDAAAGADLHSLIELWLETKEIERLVERLRKARDEELEGISHYATEPVAKKLAKTHPDVAAKMYRALGMRILKAKKSKYYDAALSNFEDARRCYERAGLGAKWESPRARGPGRAPSQDRIHARIRGGGGRRRPEREADVPRARQGAVVEIIGELSPWVDGLEAPR